MPPFSPASALRYLLAMDTMLVANGFDASSITQLNGQLIAILVIGTVHERWSARSREANA